jgi:hypothetical protein
MNDTGKQMEDDCYTDALPKARNAALAIYNSIASTPALNQSDSAFLSVRLIHFHFVESYIDFNFSGLRPGTQIT